MGRVTVTNMRVSIPYCFTSREDTARGSRIQTFAGKVVHEIRHHARGDAPAVLSFGGFLAGIEGRPGNARPRVTLRRIDDGFFEPVIVPWDAGGTGFDQMMDVGDLADVTSGSLEEGPVGNWHRNAAAKIPMRDARKLPDWHGRKQDAVGRALEAARSYAVIDGAVHRRVPEPVIVSLPHALTILPRTDPMGVHFRPDEGALAVRHWVSIGGDARAAQAVVDELEVIDPELLVREHDVDDLSRVSATACADMGKHLAYGSKRFAMAYAALRDGLDGRRPHAIRDAIEEALDVGGEHLTTPARLRSAIEVHDARSALRTATQDRGMTP